MGNVEERVLDSMAHAAKKAMNVWCLTKNGIISVDQNLIHKSTQLVQENTANVVDKTGMERHVA